MPVDSDEIKDCDPIITNKQLGFTKNVKGGDLDPNAAAFPCGLVAKSLFNDTYDFYKDKNMAEKIDINSDDIAWESDVQYKFKNIKDIGDDWQDI